jgi:hypothetical protein
MITDRTELTQQKDWVIVKGESVFHYTSWNEACVVNTMLGGHLMSKSYYENHYKDEQLQPKTKAI